jgi:hypothetical protein
VVAIDIEWKDRDTLLNGGVSRITLQEHHGFSI